MNSSVAGNLVFVYYGSTMNAAIPASALATADRVDELPQLSPAEQRLVNYLAVGTTQRAAGMAAGFSDSEVSEMLATPRIAAALELARASTLEAGIRHDTNIEDAEKLALETIVAKLPFAKSAGEAAKVFHTLNNAKKRTSPASDAAKNGDTAVQVTLVIPQAAVTQFTFNTSNQAIEVAGRSLAPLPSKALPVLAAERKQQAETARVKQIESDKAAATAKLETLQGINPTAAAGVFVVPGLDT